MAGTLTIRLSRPTAFHSRRASTSVASGIVGQIRRAFEADIAVAPLRRLVDRPQHVGRGADVADRQMLVDRRDAVIALRPGTISGRPRIRPNAPIAFSKIAGLEVTPLSPSRSIRVLQLAVADQAAAHEIEPRRLAALLQLLQRVHALLPGRASPRPPSSASAARSARARP